MTKVYVMASCPDCIEVKARLSDNPEYQITDIREHVRNLKEFLRLRDSSPEFVSIKARGSIGIPCFVAEDGSIRFEMDGLSPAAAQGSSLNFEERVLCETEGLSPAAAQGSSCSLDGKGC